MDNRRVLQAGDLVQWYRIESVIGRGGFGVTYLATDTNLDHKVAIKEYMPGWAVQRLEDNSLVPLNNEVRQDFDLGVDSFLREARTLVKFRHPNIVRVMAVFEANNTAYLVMEYEEGEEFKSYVQSGNGIDEHSLKSLILRIVDGLEQVHRYGFLHRDIKPVNLIIRNDGSPVLLDFGAARPTDGEPGAHTAYVSDGYTPIEQYQDGEGMRVGPWTDIYALGATLYYAISGKTPVGPTGRLAALVTKKPDPLTSAMEVGAGRYSDSFLQAIDSALSFKPDDRPQDLSEWRGAFGEDLPEIQSLTQAKPVDPETAKPERSARRSRRRTVWRALGKRTLVTVAAVLSITLAGSWLFRDYQQRSELEELLTRADSEFDSGALIDGALPLYRQVLGSAPNNTTARDRLAEIEEIAKDQLNTALENGDIDLAEKSLAEFQRISSDASLVQTLEQRVNTERQRQTVEQQFSQAQAFVFAGEYQQALDMLGNLRTAAPTDQRIAEIEANIQTAIDNDARQAERQNRIEEEARRKEAETRRRVAEANRRQRERRQTYNRYLRQAEHAVSEGNLSEARQSLDSARALQLSDSRLTALEAQVVEQEEYLRKPLSEYEVSYASGQFNALRRAIESKNIRSIEFLSHSIPSRKGLFDTLFDRYIRVDAQIIDVQSELDPKRVTAKLRIETMTLPNGDIVYPSPAYRDTELALNRQRFGWSQIIW